MNAQLTIELGETVERRAHPPLSSSDLLDGLCVDKFDSGWRQCAEIQRCSVTELDAFVKAHYLGKRPAIVMLALKMLVRNPPRPRLLRMARASGLDCEQPAVFGVR